MAARLTDADVRAMARPDYCHDCDTSKAARELLRCRRALRRLQDRVTLAVIAKTVAGGVGYELLETCAKALGLTRKGGK